MPEELQPGRAVDTRGFDEISRYRGQPRQEHNSVKAEVVPDRHDHDGGEREARWRVRREDPAWLEQPVLRREPERSEEPVRRAVARVEHPAPDQRHRDLRGDVREEIEQTEQPAEAEPLVEHERDCKSGRHLERDRPERVDECEKQ